MNVLPSLLVQLVDVYFVRLRTDCHFAAGRLLLSADFEHLTQLFAGLLGLEGV